MLTKKRKKINLNDLQNAINEVWENSKPINFSSLYDGVARTEWAQNNKFPHSLISKTCRENSDILEFPKFKRNARKKIIPDVSKEEMEQQVQKTESDGPLSNLTALYTAIAQSDWAKNLNLSPSRIGYLIKQHGVVTITKPGVRGRQQGLNQTRIPRAEKFKNNKNTAKSITEIKQQFSVPRDGIRSDRWDGLMTKLEKGSLSAAIKSKCLHCSNYITKEVKYCLVTGCPLWPFRPYQTKKYDEQDDVNSD